MAQSRQTISSSSSTSPSIDGFPQLELGPELEAALAKAESLAGLLHLDTSRHGSCDSSSVPPAPLTHSTVDIEDIHSVMLSPFSMFRKKRFLSVSDLVGTVWCEVQYDYRLRSLPFLPVDKRPQVITSTSGKAIPMDKVKVQGKERILRRGEKIHKRLEREIHPEEIAVTTTTREDVWGLRFLNMLSGIQALITLGKCRELPVVGFVDDVLVMGVIDELTRQPIEDDKVHKMTTRQTSLNAYFSLSKPDREYKEKTHKVFISDSKTRASGSLPRQSDTLAGRLQVMLYKELFDGLITSKAPLAIDNSSPLPSRSGFMWSRVWEYLDLEPKSLFSDVFLSESRAIILGNGLTCGASDAKNLSDMVEVWERYVPLLGLGKGAVLSQAGMIGDKEKTGQLGCSEDRLELVYRRAIAKEGGQRKKRRKEEASHIDESPTTIERDRDISRIEADIVEDTTPQLAPQQSIKLSAPDKLNVGPSEVMNLPLTRRRRPSRRASDHSSGGRNSEAEREEDEIALAIEMSLGAFNPISGDTKTVGVGSSQATSTPSSSIVNPSQSETSNITSNKDSSAAGSVIGRSTFTHDPRLLEQHLQSVLDFWMGRREPVGVSLEETRRCGWCEFEEGCEWRLAKAEEAGARAKRRAAIRSAEGV
ncbi:hypothetical protein M231_02930 [Tremella mesenterica]|uniref:Exonuclease V n=1 Tax=Tremella mesenterica TaxID=5217 RepID=A0A4V1M4B0_TREME|nr:hypothetical protein M231_02930 [Tremella mesenterica]